MGKLVGIMVSPAAYEVDGQVGTAVWHDVAAEEGAEIVNDQLADFRHVQMSLDERRQRSQKTVGHRLAVDTGNNVCYGQAHLLMEIVNHRLGQKAFVEGVLELDA